MKGGQRIGAGRPASANSKTELIQARVTPEELENVKETAAHYGKSVSDLIRAALGLAVLLGFMACAAPEAASYSVEWGIAPAALHGCDTLTLEGEVLSWDGPACKVPAAVEGESFDEFCSWYPDGDAGWWICEDVDEPERVVGELIVDGVVVADFSAVSL